MRRAAKVDASQTAIVQALRKAGASVTGFKLRMRSTRTLSHGLSSVSPVPTFSGSPGARRSPLASI